MEPRLRNTAPTRALPSAALLVVLALAVPAARAQAQPPHDVLIVGDISASLKGFATRAPKQMETLYRVLFTNSPSTQLARMPGERDVVQLIPRERVGLFADAAAYTGQTTPLGETIRRATANYPAVAVVTDAMESDNRYLELQEAVASAAEGGWGVWLLLVPLPFDGKYDLEQPLNAQEQLAQMQECVRQADPGWSVTVSESARRTVNFVGERPLIILFFDQSPEQGREYVLRVAAGIEANLGRGPQTVELSPLYLREFAVGAGEASNSFGVAMSDEGSGARRIIADPKEGGAAKELSMPVTWKRPRPRIEQPFEEEWVLDRTKPASWGNLQIVAGGKDSPGALDLSVSARLTWWEWFRRLFSSGNVQRDEPFQFDVYSTVEQPVDGWWNAQSEETSWRCPHKVFKLKSLVERISGVARERILKDPPRESYTLRLQIGAS